MKIFDFIIVGGGTSGTVTAEKLIKNGHTVLIIEEGKKSKADILFLADAGALHSAESKGLFIQLS